MKTRKLMNVLKIISDLPSTTSFTNIESEFKREREKDLEVFFRFIY